MQLWQYCLLVIAKNISSRPMACTSGCSYSC